MTHHDITHPVPESQRRGPVTLGLVWLTMVTCFPCVLAGFQWCKDGVSLSQTLVCCIVSCLLLLAYTVPVCLLSARTGLGYAELNRRVFGKGPAALINCNLIWIFVGWYGIASLLLAEGLNGLCHWHLPLAPFAAVLAVLMAVNNFFGFKGIANFARFFAAPVLIGWVIYSAVKAVPSCPPSVWTEAAHTSLPQALTMVSSFVIGIAVWGNEADYWRYSRPKISHSLIPLTITLAIGQVLFPMTGWILSRSTGITDYAQATEFMNNWSFGGIAAIGALVLVASFFAANDSNLFGSSQTFKSLTGLSHRCSVAILTALGAGTAVALAHFGAAKSLESIVMLNCIILPTTTVIVVAEYYLSRKTIHAFVGTNWKATLAVGIAIFVGMLTSGIIPGTEALHVGICPLQTWLVALGLYVPLRKLQLRKPMPLAGETAAELTPALVSALKD